MKVSNLCSVMLLVSFASTAIARKKRRRLYGSGIGPLSAASRIRKLKICRGLLTGKADLGQNLKHDSVRKCWTRPILEDHEIFGAWFSLIPTLRATDPEGFYNFHRMTEATFDRLLDLVTPYVTKRSYRVPVCPGERLAVTLRYLASGNSFVDLSYLFRVSQQCISKIVLEMTTVLWCVLESSVFEEFNTDNWLRHAAEFASMWDLPHCLGAIDGKHVNLRAFAHCGSQFFNYKKTHSMILMAIADAKYRFTMADFGASGRRGDSNTFRFCAFGKKLRHALLDIPPPLPHSGFKQDVPFFFAGDAAFSGCVNVLTPFKGEFLPPEEAVFNYRLSRARRVVENAFGILVARFRILGTLINGSQSLIKSIVLCCVALHNMHLRDEASIPPKKRRYCPEGYADSAEDTPGRWRNENKNQEASFFSSFKGKLKINLGAARPSVWNVEEVTEIFLEYFIDNSLPWQWHSAQVHV